MATKVPLKEFTWFIVRLLKPYRWAVMWCGALSLAAAGLDMAGPIIMGRGFDLAGRHSAFLWYGGALVIWFAARVGADLIRMVVSLKGDLVGEEAAQDYTRQALLILLDKPLVYHFGSKINETSDKIGRLRWEIDAMIVGTVFELIPAIISIAITLTYLLVLDWRIAAVLAVTIGAYLAYTYAAAGERVEKNAIANKARRESETYAWDALRNVLVVKSTTNEGIVDSQLREGAKKYMKALIDWMHVNNRMLVVQDIISNTGALGAVLFGALGFASGRLTFGQLSAVTAFAFTIFGHIRWAQWQFGAFLRTATAYQDVQPELASPGEDFAAGQVVKLQGDVEYRHVRFRYREDKPALEDINFKVPRGTRVAIVGESGEGKSTLIDLLGRYYEPQGGEIFVDGVPVRSVNLNSLRSQMAYVPQDLSLFHESIGFNIRYGRPDAKDEEVYEAARLARLSDFIDSLPEKFDTKVGERGLRLSGGERQRVALARAFLRDPAILVLDEPTSNLDSKTEEYIRASLEHLMKGRTTFIIAHRLRTIKEADLILVLKEGRIVEKGTHDELVARPDSAYVEFLRAQGGLGSEK